MKKIQIFEHTGCQPSRASELSQRLGEHYGDTAVSVYDLSKPDGPVPLPPTLFLKMEGGDTSCLPAMTVDSVLVTQGWLPDASEVLAVVERAEPVAGPTSRPEQGCCDPGADDNSCCG